MCSRNSALIGGVGKDSESIVGEINNLIKEFHE